jgi:hypothetical protein
MSRLFKGSRDAVQFSDEPIAFSARVSSFLLCLISLDACFVSLQIGASKDRDTVVKFGEVHLRRSDPSTSLTDDRIVDSRA